MMKFFFFHLFFFSAIASASNYEYMKDLIERQLTLEGNTLIIVGDYDDEIIGQQNLTNLKLEIINSIITNAKIFKEISLLIDSLRDQKLSKNDFLGYILSMRFEFISSRVTSLKKAWDSKRSGLFTGRTYLDTTPEKVKGYEEGSLTSILANLVIDRYQVYNWLIYCVLCDLKLSSNAPLEEMTDEVREWLNISLSLRPCYYSTQQNEQNERNFGYPEQAYVSFGGSKNQFNDYNLWEAYQLVSEDKRREFYKNYMKNHHFEPFSFDLLQVDEFSVLGSQEGEDRKKQKTERQIARTEKKREKKKLKKQKQMQMQMQMQMQKEKKNDALEEMKEIQQGDQQGALKKVDFKNQLGLKRTDTIESLSNRVPQEFDDTQEKRNDQDELKKLNSSDLSWLQLLFSREKAWLSYHDFLRIWEKLNGKGTVIASGGGSHRRLKNRLGKTVGFTVQPHGNSNKIGKGLQDGLIKAFQLVGIKGESLGLD